MSVGISFISTGGHKMVRALRSLRRAEPNLPVYIVLDTSSMTWKSDRDNNPSLFQRQPNVQVRTIQNNAHINGALNKAVEWMKELKYDYVCLFHDDIVFSSLEEHRGHISEWLKRLESDSRLQNASALTFSLMESFVPNKVPGHWHRHSSEWDTIDLESKSLWETLCPNGKPAGHFDSGGNPTHEVHFDTWFVRYYTSETVHLYIPLGPTGQIIPVRIWDEVGGFDEQFGIHYDSQYPAECAIRNLPPILVIPNIPHLHLHNQSIGYADPAVGLWGDVSGAFTRKYGKDIETFWKEKKDWQWQIS